MGHHKWHCSRLVSNRVMGSLIYFAIVAVMITILTSHIALKKPHFAMSDVFIQGKQAIVGRMSAQKHTQEEQPAANQKLKEPSSTKKPVAAELTEAGLTSLENITKPILLVIVSSSPRSGSSFLGELLSSPRQALYLFEPFWYHSHYQRHIFKHIIDTKADKLVKKELHSLLECRISEVADMFDSRLGLTVWRKPLIMVPLSVRQRTSMCQDLKLRVIKVIRPKLSSVLPLLKDPDLNVHVLSLVRDPRGIVNSVSGVDSWSKHLTPPKACLMLRNDVEASLEFADHPRLLRVRYEDLVARPEEEARRMFAWLELNLPAEVLQFLDLHTRRTTEPPAINVTDTANSTSSSSSSSAQATSKPTDIANVGINVTLNPSTEAPTSNTSVTSSDQNVTSSLEPKPTERPITQEEFNDFYGTIRNAKFDGLHWLKDLDQNVRKETEKVCKDVLESLNYPLIYPQEKREEETTSTTRTV